MIVCITGNFEIYDSNGRKTGRKEFVVSHGVDSETGQNVILPTEDPRRLGAIFDSSIGEWVLV